MSFFLSRTMGQRMKASKQTEQRKKKEGGVRKVKQRFRRRCSFTAAAPPPPLFVSVGGEEGVTAWVAVDKSMNERKQSRSGAGDTRVPRAIGQGGEKQRQNKKKAMKRRSSHYAPDVLAVTLCTCKCFFFFAPLVPFFFNLFIKQRVKIYRNMEKYKIFFIYVTHMVGWNRIGAIFFFLKKKKYGPKEAVRATPPLHPQLHRFLRLRTAASE